MNYYNEKNNNTKYQALVILGNTKKETFNIVLKHIRRLGYPTVDSLFSITNTKENSPELLYKRSPLLTIKHVFLMDTKDSHEENLPELIREKLGDHINITHAILPEDVPSAYDRIVDMMEAAVKLYPKENILVDLTNGTKIHSSALYAISSLIGINSMYQLVKTRDNDIGYRLEYRRVPKFDKIEILPRVGYFEIVYYLLELEEVFKDIQRALFIEYAYTKIRDGILEYFEIKTKNGNDYQRSLSETVTWVEKSINILYEFIEEITNKKFNENNTTGKLRRIKSEIKKNNIPADHLKYLRGIPHLLELLWEYRHISAHQSKIMYQISPQEAVIAIEASLEIFRRIKQDQEILNRFLLT